MTGGRATHGKKRHSQVAVSMREGVERQERGCTISLLDGSPNHTFFGIILRTIFKKEKKMRRINVQGAVLVCVCVRVGNGDLEEDASAEGTEELCNHFPSGSKPINPTCTCVRV